MSNVILLTTGYDKTIKHWEATLGTCHTTVKLEEAQANRLEITSDKRFYAAASLNKIHIFDMNTDKPIQTYDGHNGNVTAVGFQRDAHWMFSGGEDGKVKIWDFRSRQCSREFSSPGPVNTVALHPGNGELISGDNLGHIRVWEIGKGGTCSTELVPAPHTPVRSITISSDGKMFVAASNTGTCYCWKIEGDSEHAAVFSPTQRLLAHPDEYILKAAISPDNNLLATTSSDTTVKIWKKENDSFVHHNTLPGPPGPGQEQDNFHRRWVWDCVWSVDAAYLVTACSDTLARLWDVNTGALLKSYGGHSKACTACALNDSYAEASPADGISE